MTRLPGLDMSTGSLGQGLSAGVGMAIAAKLGGKSYRTFVVIGDGESQEGQVWEAAHVAARYKLDNLVGILDWNRFQQFGWRADGMQQAHPLENPRQKFEAFGWHVIETDGHDQAQLLRALEEARGVQGRPVMIVAHTIKGRGVSFMENQADWHAKAPNDQQLATALSDLGGDLMLVPDPAAVPYQAKRWALPMAPTRRFTPVPGKAQAQRDVFGNELIALSKTYPNLVVLDGDLANSTKADLFAAAVPERFLQMGIAEQNMASAAAGLAHSGYIPWISTFTSFIVKRSLDQIRVQVAQTHANVKLVGSYSGIMTNRTGKSHQSLADLAVMRSIPGLVVVAPADGEEAAQAMAAMMAYQGPVYLRLNREPSPAIFDKSYTFKLGAGVVLREGTDVALISTGVQTSRALEAAELLAKDGISARVLHLPTVKPLDTGAIVAAAKATKRVLVTEEHTVTGGLGSAVAEVLSELHPVPVKRHGIEDTFAESGSDDELLSKYGLTAAHVAALAKEWCRG